MHWGREEGTVPSVTGTHLGNWVKIQRPRLWAPCLSLGLQVLPQAEAGETVGWNTPQLSPQRVGLVGGFEGHSLPDTSDLYLPCSLNQRKVLGCMVQARP